MHTMLNPAAWLASAATSARNRTLLVSCSASAAKDTLTLCRCISSCTCTKMPASATRYSPSGWMYMRLWYESLGLITTTAPSAACMGSVARAAARGLSAGHCGSPSNLMLHRKQSQPAPSSPCSTYAAELCECPKKPMPKSPLCSTPRRCQAQRHATRTTWHARPPHMEQDQRMDVATQRTA